MFRNDNVKVIDTHSRDYNPNSLAFWDQFDLKALHLLLSQGVIGVLQKPSIPNTPDLKGCLNSLLIHLHSYTHLYHSINDALENSKRPWQTPRFNSDCELFLELIASVAFHLHKFDIAAKPAGILGNEYTLIDRVEYNHYRIRFNFMAAIAYRDTDEVLACQHYKQALEMCQFTKTSSDTVHEILEGIRFLFNHKPGITEDSQFWTMIYRLDLPGLVTTDHSQETNIKVKEVIVALTPDAPEFLRHHFESSRASWDVTGFNNEAARHQYMMGSR